MRMILTTLVLATGCVPEADGLLLINNSAAFVDCTVLAGNDGYMEWLFDEGSVSVERFSGWYFVQIGEHDEIELDIASMQDQFTWATYGGVFDASWTYEDLLFIISSCTGGADPTAYPTQPYNSDGPWLVGDAAFCRFRSYRHGAVEEGGIVYECGDAQ